VPDIGEISEAETFLNFVSLHPKVSSTTKGSKNKKSESTILTDTPEKSDCRCPLKQLCFQDVGNTHPPEVKVRI